MLIGLKVNALRRPQKLGVVHIGCSTKKNQVWYILGVAQKKQKKQLGVVLIGCGTYWVWHMKKKLGIVHIWCGT